MSFILEALKKAERDRTAGQAPAVEDALRSLARQQPRSDDTRLRTVAVVVASAVLVGVTIYVLLKQHAPQPSMPASAVAPVTPPLTGPVTAVAIVATPLPSPTLPSAPGVAMRVDPERLQAPVAAPELALDHPDYAVPANDDATMDELVETPAANNHYTPPPVDVQRDSGGRHTAAPAPVIATELPTEPDVRGLKDMPPSFRADFPKLSIEVHSYDDNPLRRFVLINGKKYRETDTLPEGVSIFEIVPEGVIFERHGTRVLQEIRH